MAQGGGGSAGSHWEARVLRGEYMSSEAADGDSAYVSRMTLALITGTGW